VIGVIIILVERRRAQTLTRILCDLVFFGYLVGVVNVTMFPIVIDSYFVEQMRLYSTIADGINMVPIVSFTFGIGGDEVAKQIAFNVLLGIPFGFGLPFLGTRSVRRILVLGIIFAVGIEFLQLLLDLAYGFPFRTVDINDVICNALGVAVGIGLFRAAKMLYRRLKLSQDDVGVYLDGVLTA
jgi:glycopeptide antibiotics resistance protein